MKKTLAYILIIVALLLSVCAFCACGASSLRIDFTVEGEEYYTLVVKSGEVISFPKSPEKEDKIFLGWYFMENGEERMLRSDFLITGDIEIENIQAFAKFIPKPVAHVHSYIATVYNPDCFNKGYIEYVCECGESYRENEVDKKEHKFENYLFNNDSTCEENGTETAVCINGCGESDTREKENSKKGHAFLKYFSNNDATYEADGTKTAKCDNGCGKSKTIVDEGSKLKPGHTHTYDQKVEILAYLVQEASCTRLLTYYYSCECGARGDQTFEVGDYLPHAFETYSYDYNATCNKDGTETAYCVMGCGESDTRVKANTALDHDYKFYLFNNDSTCEENGTETAICSNGCGESDTRVKENSKKGHSFIHYAYNSDATCEENGTETSMCSNGCGERHTREKANTALGHLYERYLFNNDSTCEDDGTETAICSNGCGESDTRVKENSKKGHSFIHYAYNSDATCEENGTETSICFNGCGESHTREKANTALGHLYERYLFNNDSTCEENGTETAICSNGCGESDTRVKENSKKGHAFENYISNNDATYDSDGTKTAVCANGCGESDTVVDEGSKLIWSEITISNLEKVGDTEYGLTLPYATDEYDFTKDISAVGNSTYSIRSEDRSMTYEDKKVELLEGRNVFYIYADVAGEKSEYKVVLYRRIMVRVTFAEITSVYVEEGQYLEVPSRTPTREGYNFDGWNYDFFTPLSGEKKNLTIYPIWTVKTYNYVVNYYFENSSGSYQKDSSYGIVRQGAYNETVSVLEEDYLTFEHYVYEQSKSRTSGKITAREVLQLNLYYSLDTHEVTFYKEAVLTSEMVVKTVKHGQTVVAPDFEKHGYELSWDKSLTNITQNCIITAVWTPKTQSANVLVGSTSMGIVLVTTGEIVDLPEYTPHNPLVLTGWKGYAGVNGESVCVDIQDGDVCEYLFWKFEAVLESPINIDGGVMLGITDYGATRSEIDLRGWCYPIDNPLYGGMEISVLQSLTNGVENNTLKKLYLPRSLKSIDLQDEEHLNSLSYVEYEGTIMQFKLISNWWTLRNIKCPAMYVQCKDGVIRFSDMIG